jgi:hypothetical protein
MSLLNSTNLLLRRRRSCIATQHSSRPDLHLQEGPVTREAAAAGTTQAG